MWNFGSSGNQGGFQMTVSNWASSTPSEVHSRLEQLKKCYRKYHPSCKFNRWFYNRIDSPFSVNLTLYKLQRRFNEKRRVFRTSDWNGAQKDNPNPKEFVPFPIRSAEGLFQRILHQAERRKRFVKQITDTREQILSYESEQKKLEKRLQKIKGKQVLLTTRVLEVRKKNEVLNQLGKPIYGLDRKLKVQLEKMDDDLGSEEITGKVNLSNIKLHTYLKNSAVLQRSVSSLDLGKNEKKIKMFLTKQNNGLKKLISILQKDFEDLKTMKKILDTKFGNSIFKKKSEDVLF